MQEWFGIAFLVGTIVITVVAAVLGVLLSIKLIGRVWHATFPPNSPAVLTDKFCQDSDCRSVNPPAAVFCRRCGSTLVPVSRQVGRWLGRMRVESRAKVSA